VPVPPTGEPRLGMWVIAVAIGFVVAVLGVQAALGAIQRQQYSEARLTTVYFLKNGNVIRGSLERLEEINARDYALMKETRAALEAGDTSRFDRLMAQADLNSVEQKSLQKKVKVLQEGLGLAVKQ
jgi:hypothetical protein